MQKFFLDAYVKKIEKQFPLYSSSLDMLLDAQLAMPKSRLIIIVSDFLAYGEEQERKVNMLRQKHEVRLVQIDVVNNNTLKESLLLHTFS